MVLHNFKNTVLQVVLEAIEHAERVNENDQKDKDNRDLVK